MLARMTAAQATVKFLRNQFSARDGKEYRFFGGCLGIFGHGNVAGIGQALEQDAGLRYYLFRNEQGMVHAASGFAKAIFRHEDAGVHNFGGPRRNKHGDRSCAGYGEPLACITAAGRRVCAEKRGASIAAVGISSDAGYFCERLLQAGFALLGPN